MSGLRQQVSELIANGEAFTYENFAKHCEPEAVKKYTSRVAIVFSTPTWPEVIKPEFNEWLTRTGTVLLKAYGENHHAYRVFESKGQWPLVRCDNDRFYEVRNALLGALRALAADLDSGVVADVTLSATHAPSATAVRLVCQHFHSVAVQLRRRREERATLVVKDEYDVQDLLHALLKLYFDDIRPEEWTPSYAGSSARMDFLLKGAGIVIEVKKTREGLADKQLGNQLIEDVAHYAGHSECEHLVCFIYDPEDRVENRSGIKRDIEKQSREGLAVEVIIGR